MAIFIDGIIVGIPMGIIGGIIGGIYGFSYAMSHPGGKVGFTDADGNLNGSFIIMELCIVMISMVVKWLYYALQESSSAQATIGKRVMSLKVTNLEGQRIGFGQASGRFFCENSIGNDFVYRLHDGRFYGAETGAARHDCRHARCPGLTKSRPMNAIELPEGYVISGDQERLNLAVIHTFISQSYWAKAIPGKILERSIKNSLCWGVYFREAQVGFARIITDKATFAYLADVFVLPEHRGKGLSKALVATIVAHPDLQGLRRWMLVTIDAHGLYEQFGFKTVPQPERHMEILHHGMYERAG